MIIPTMILSSAIFGIIHLQNLAGGSPLLIVIPQCINAMVFGFLVCTVYMRCGNVLPTMILHGLFDFGKMIHITVLQEGGGYGEETAAQINDLSFFIILALEMAAYAAIAFYLIRPSKRGEICSVWDKKWSRE